MLNDLRYSIRMLLKSPGFAVVAILTLALGIGANTAIFSVVYAVLLRPLPYMDCARPVHLFANDAGSGTSYRSFELWKVQSRSFEDVAVYYKNTGISRVTIRGLNEPESVQAGFTSANLFPLLGLAPTLGRVFTVDEELRRERVSVISVGLWRTQFGSAQDVIGRSIEVDGTLFTIIGVMPAVFQFPSSQTQLWLPITTHHSGLDQPPRDNVHGRGYFMRWNVVARLRPGVSRELAQAEMNAIVERLEKEDADLNMGLRVNVVPLSVEITPNAKLTLLTLLGSVLFVLLIACSNPT